MKNNTKTMQITHYSPRMIELIKGHFTVNHRCGRLAKKCSTRSTDWCGCIQL